MASEELLNKITHVLSTVTDTTDGPAIATQARVIASSGAYRLAGDDLAVANREAVKLLRQLGPYERFVHAVADTVAAKQEHPAMKTHARLQALGFASIDDALEVEQARASGEVAL